MTMLKFTAFCAVAATISACSIVDGQRTGADRAFDGGFDAKHLSELVAGVWVDPNGCDHWIIDDGIEGYLSERLTPDGRPVCSGIAPPNTATGPFQAGSDFFDPL